MEEKSSRECWEETLFYFSSFMLHKSIISLVKCEKKGAFIWGVEEETRLAKRAND